MEDVPRYPNHMKEEIKRRGYALNEVAKALYISERTLRNYCAGRRAIPREILVRLAELLECPITALVDDAETRGTEKANGREIATLPAPPLPSAAIESIVLQYVSGEQTRLMASGNHHIIHPLALQAYKDVLNLAWETFYTSCAQHAAGAVHHWLLYLAQAISVASGSLRDQLLAFRCRFLQLSSVLARDRAEFQAAFDAINEAIILAIQLQDSELIASSLYRRAKIHAKQQSYAQAIRDLENALPYAKRSRDPLRCYIFMLLAEMYSLLTPADASLFQKSLKLLDEIDRAVRTYGVLEGDGSFVKVDTPGLYMIRGDVLRRSGAIKEAQNALLIAKESLPKEFIRWRGNLCLSEAQLAFADGDIGGSCQLALLALDFIEVTRSQSNTGEVRRLYSDITRSGKIEPSHPRLKDLGARLGVA
jgi:transcriptional regulator with XRE-family HTH domain